MQNCLGLLCIPCFCPPQGIKSTAHFPFIHQFHFLQKAAENSLFHLGFNLDASSPGGWLSITRTTALHYLARIINSINDNSYIEMLTWQSVAELPNNWWPLSLRDRGIQVSGVCRYCVHAGWIESTAAKEKLILSVLLLDLPFFECWFQKWPCYTMQLQGLCLN